MTASKLILCVDDEAPIVEFLQLMFERDGFRVATAEGGWPAFEMIQAQSFDFVLSDVRMVKGDGIELLENVQGLEGRRPPVALLSAYTDVQTPDIFDRGAVAFLQKPILWPQIVETVRRVTSPREERWRGNGVQGDLLRMSWPSWKAALASGTLALGTGGLFVSTPEVFMVDAPVSFDFTFEEGLPGRLTGSAVVRWHRAAARHGFLPGLGLELMAVEPTSMPFLCQEITRMDPKATVPIGYKRAGA